MPWLENRIPPPIIALVFALVMVGASWATPLLGYAMAGRAVPAVLAGAGGVAIIISAITEFRHASTTVNPLDPGKASTLVQSGIFSRSRNPMYAGLSLILTGWAVYLANLLALILVAMFIAYLSRFQIAPEERALQKLFGAAYDDYKSRVRRWL